MTSFLLKLIALFSMLLDHSLKALPLSRILLARGIAPSFSYSLIDSLLPLGRLAFPIFAFQLAEGCRRTKNPGKYLLRLSLFALVSEIPFQLAFGVGLRFAASNVGFTLLLGALASLCYERLRRFHPVLAFFPFFLCFLLAQLLHTDYAGFGVALIFFLYLFSGKLPTLLVLGIGLTLHNLIRPILLLRAFPPSQLTLPLWLGSLLSLIPIGFYSGERGPKCKGLFYFFYPVHLTLLFLLARFLV